MTHANEIVRAVCLLAVLSPAQIAFSAIEDQNVPQAEPPPVEIPVPVLTKAPELIEFVNAPYPEQLLYQGISGDVLLLIDIDAGGLVERVEVTSASHPDLTMPAMAAASRFKFSPAEIDYAPAAIRIEYRYRFVAQLPEPDAIAGQPTRDDEAELDVNFTGQILEAGMRRPVPGAVITINGRAVTESNAKGEFEVRGVPEGEVKVRVSITHFQTYEVEEEITARERLVVKYYLLRESQDPYHTVVRTKVQRREAAKVQIERRELSKSPGTMGDPIKVIENLPGMARAPGGIGGALLVRGANPSDTQVFIDGVPVPVLYHFGGLTSVITPGLLERIDFYPGGFGARYGRAIAGVVDVVTRDLDCDLWRGDVDVSLNLAASGYTCVPVNETWRAAVAARRSYIEAFLPLVLENLPRGPDEGYLSLTPSYADWQLKLQSTQGPSDFSVFFFGADDQFKLAQAGSAENISLDLGFRQTWLRIAFRHRLRIQDRATLTTTVTPGFTSTGFTAGSSALDGEARFGLGIWSVSVREDFRLELFDGFTLRAGFDGEFGRADLSFAAPVGAELASFPSPVQMPSGSLSLREEMPAFNHAYWLEAEWEPGLGISIIPGIRLDVWDFHQTEAVSVMPRLNARWEFADGMTAKAAYGMYEMLPDPMQGQLLESPIGNPELQPLLAHQFIIGYEHEITDLIHLDVQGFYNMRRRIPEGSGSTTYRDGEIIPEVWTNSGGGNTYGIEVLLRHLAAEPGAGGGSGSLLDRFRGRFYGWIAYTLSESIRWTREPGSTYTVSQGDGTVLTREYSERSAEPYRAPFDQTHILTVVGQLILPYGFEVGARFRLVSGNPFTPHEGAPTWVDVDRDAYGIDHSGIPVNSDRMPMFHQLDVRVDKTWTFDLWRLTLYLEILNVYNAQNVEQFQYDYRYLNRTSVSFLPFLPVIGAKGAW